MGPKPQVPVGSTNCYTAERPYTFTGTTRHPSGSYFCGDATSAYNTQHVPQCPNSNLVTSACGRSQQIEARLPALPSLTRLPPAQQPGDAPPSSPCRVCPALCDGCVGCDRRRGGRWWPPAGHRRDWDHRASIGIERFASSSSWRVSAMSRRQPDYDLGIAEWSHLDLDDRDGTVEALQLVNEVTPVTHCVFGAVFEQPGGLTDSWASKDMIERNDQMFRAFLDAAVVHCKDMRHLTVMQGGKAYGVPGGNVLAPQLPPFKERRPRVHDGELATDTPRSNSC